MTLTKYKKDVCVCVCVWWGVGAGAVKNQQIQDHMQCGGECNWLSAPQKMCVCVCVCVCVSQTLVSAKLFAAELVRPWSHSRTKTHSLYIPVQSSK